MRLTTPTLLFLDHADCISEVARVGHPCWAGALSLSMNELHICLKAKARIDRLQLRSRIILRVGPLLNALQSAELSGTMAIATEEGTKRRAGSGRS